MAPVISSGTLRKMHRLRSRVVRPNLWEMAPLKRLTERIQMDLEQIWFLTREEEFFDALNNFLHLWKIYFYELNNFFFLYRIGN